MTVYSSCKLGVIVPVFSSCERGGGRVTILVVNWGYNDCVF